MSNHHYKLDHLRLNVSSILKRLPVHRQLNESQNYLIKVTPTCQAWLAKHIAEEFIATTQLTAFKDGALTITCHSSICASQIKHQKINLLETLHSANFNAIKRLSICVNQESITETNADVQTENLGQASDTDFKRSTTSKQSIENIEHCHKSVKNELLAESLKKLAETLKKNN